MKKKGTGKLWCKSARDIGYLLEVNLGVKTKNMSLGDKPFLWKISHLCNKGIEGGETLSAHLGGGFLVKLVHLFHSALPAEVDFAKVVVHLLYSHLVTLRDEIRVALSQYCWDFLYADSGTPNRNNLILQIMNAILHGLDEAQLADTDTWHMVLEHVPCPMHKARDLHQFHEALAQCVASFIKARILKLAKKAGVMCDDRFGDVFRCVIARIRRNLTSAYYRVVDDTIGSLKEKLLRSCISPTAESRAGRISTGRSSTRAARTTCT